MGQRDYRYEIVQMMIETGRVRCFRDIFKYIPKTRVANDLGMKVDRWNQKADDLAEFGIRELQLIAFFIGVNRRVVIDLVLEEMDENDKRMTNDQV